MQTESDVIEGCRKGDRAAQEALFRRFADKMMGVCLRYCRSEEDARDLLHDGFIKVFHHIGTFRGESQLRTWMSRIFVNTAINFYKKAWHRHTHISLDAGEDGPGLTGTDEADDDALYEGIEPELVLNWVQELPEKYRLLINLYYVDGYPHKDICKLLNLSESASKVQLHRARKLLQDKITAYKKQYETARQA